MCYTKGWGRAMCEEANKLRMAWYRAAGSPIRGELREDDTLPAGILGRVRAAQSTPEYRTALLALRRHVRACPRCQAIWDDVTGSEQ